MKTDNTTMICLTVVIVSFLFSVVSCQPTAEELEAQAKVVEAETAQLEAEKEAELELQSKNAAEIRILIQRGVPPFAARCAVVGPSWYESSSCSNASEEYMEASKDD